MLQLKIKTPLLKNINIECHYDALRPFTVAKDYKYQYEQLHLTKEVIQLLQTFDPIHAVEVSKNQYKFFSGWYWLASCRHLNCNKVAIIVHSDIEQHDIQQAAWAYLLSNQFKSFHRGNNLVQLRHYLDSMPDHITKSLLSSISTSSSQILVQRFSNETRSAVRNQQKHFICPDTIIDKPSIREQLTNGSKNVT